jgi:hypothetical protein
MKDGSVLCGVYMLTGKHGAHPFMQSCSLRQSRKKINGFTGNEVPGIIEIEIAYFKVHARDPIPARITSQ